MDMQVNKGVLRHNENQDHRCKDQVPRQYGNVAVVIVMNMVLDQEVAVMALIMGLLIIQGPH